MACFTLNNYIFKKLKIEDIKFYLLTIFIIIFNLSLIYIAYCNAKKLGFSDGLLYGQVGNNLYYDSYGYYYQSKIVSDLWKNRNFISYFTGGIEKKYIDRGIYNYFILWNSLLNILFGNDLNSLIIIKYQFSIISNLFLYKISNEFLQPKYSRIVVLLMNLYPGFIYINIDLMRDNIILFLILFASYLVIVNNNQDNKNNEFKIWKLFIFLIGIITYIRIYIGILLGLTLIIYYLYDKLSLKKIIQLIILIIAIIFIVGKITEFMGYGFLAVNILSNKENIELGRWQPYKANSPIKLILWSLYFVFTGGRANISNIYINSLFEILNTISPIFIIIFIMPTFLIFLFKNKKQNKKIILFSFLYSSASAIVVFYYFTGIIPRLYICWLWTQLIIFGMVLENITKLSKNIKLICKIEYIIFIIFCVTIFTK
ncbi:glycosyltransferase family 39 protein [Caloramator sp. E03]|uniref:glycosyltransferase family 39 protein n=1 Tax=Caloramator sp. E03 TaxID=2576307 RepID=UPI00143D14D6|nr:glycosyltransferase family 39 protein [Caloramator sp. E03]